MAHLRVAGRLARKNQTLFSYGLSFSIPFGAVSALFVAVHPHPLYVQVINHVIPEAHKSIPTFLSYYLTVLWNFETPLLIGAVLGIVLLAWYERRLAVLFGLFFILITVPMYIFLPNIERYAMPMVPMLALLSGYGVYRLWLWHRALGVGLLAALLIYSGVLYLRYEVLLLRPDTRVEAKEWIERTTAVGATVIVDSDRLRFFGTSESLRIQAGIAPESLRAPDRLLMHADDLAERPLRYFALHFVPKDKKGALVSAALRGSGSVYYVRDSWATATSAHLLKGSTVKEFRGNLGAEMFGALFIGGDEHRVNRHLMMRLYESEQLGPDIAIYQVR